MTMTDPIADMLTRVRNANQAYHDDVSMPSASSRRAWPRSCSRRATSPPTRWPSRRGRGRQVADHQLKYGRNRERSIAGVRRISKPGLRVYAKHTGLPKVLGGLGVAIISTSQGLLTDRQANQKGVGGEVLAYVW